MSDSDSDDPQYTITINGKRYELNEDARQAIQDRAAHEYAENQMFSTFWKVVSPDQYEEDVWEETVHEQGDPVLVIETEGPMVPWEKIDQLQVEMQEVGPDSQLDRQMDQADTDPNQHNNGNGVRTIDPDDVDDAEKEIGRTHFSLTPQDFEEVPDPDGEEPDKVPPKPDEMDDDPALIVWAPDHPDVEHTWAAGEAITSMHNRVEWNVQQKADQPRPGTEKESSNDHWESILEMHNCEVIGEPGLSQDLPDNNSDTNDEKQEDVPQHYKEGKYGGNNWGV